jgi:ketopantoate reductase
VYLGPGKSDGSTGLLMVVSRSESVLIVGAGCFGISTAYHLLQRGFTDVTVLDQSEELPAPDAASTDINKSEGNACFLVRSRDHDT